MLLLNSTTEIIRLITGSAASVTVHANYADNASGAITVGKTANAAAITTATTTTIVDAPSATIQRNVRGIYVTNKHASASVQVTIQHFDGTNSADLMGVTLLAGENLVFNEEGDWHHHDAQGAEYMPSVTNKDFGMVYGIAGTVAETLPRHIITNANLSALVSGALFLQAIYLQAGQLISNICLFSGATAAGTPTNGFFALYDINRSLLAQSANFTTEAWPATTLKTKALTAQYKVPTSGLYYVGIMITATTVPTLAGMVVNTSSALANVPPILHGNGSTGLTTTLPATSSAIGATINAVWAALT